MASHEVMGSAMLILGSVFESVPTCHEVSRIGLLLEILNVHYTHGDHCDNHHHNHHTDDQKRSADRGEAHWPVGAVGRRMPNQQNIKIG